MSIIYQPAGKAREYSELAANLYRGCSHGCVYCFAPSAIHISRDGFTKSVAPRKDVLTRLARDAEKLKGDTRQILLSFTSDPYQPLEERLGLTRAALRIMIDAGLRVTVLTKAGDLAQRDFHILANSPHSQFAVTLTTDDPAESINWEPGAALPAERIHNLKVASTYGISTWVSFEPVFNPAAVLRLIDATAPFVDFYKVGKLNYFKMSTPIDWPAFREEVTAKLQAAGKPFLIKKDLAEAR